MSTPTPEGLEATGNCYEDCLELTMFERPGWVIVHGRPTLQREPYCEYGHAWLEKDGQVFCPTQGVGVPCWLYYSIGDIDYRDNLVYTREEAQRFALLTGHSGPWEGVDGEPATEENLEEWGDRPLPKRSLEAEKPAPPLTEEVIREFLRPQSDGG